MPAPLPALTGFGDPLIIARGTIDAIDDQILDLLARRARWVETIGQIKGTGLPVNAYYRPEREREVLERLATRDRGPMEETEVRTIFRTIMDIGLRIQVRQANPTQAATPLPIAHHPV